MGKKFSTTDIIKFIQTVNCMSFERFFEMYEHTFDYVSKGYVEEKFNSCRNNIGFWMCSIDYENLEKMFDFCLND